MMKRMNISKTWPYVFGALVLVLASVMTGFSNETGAAEGTYTWHSELVELDKDAGTAAFKARILSYAEIDDFASFAAGDRISLTWSGINDRADGLRAVKAEFRFVEDARFTMPAEFVSTEHDDRYLTFRLPISAEGIEAIASLEPGEWVTLTSPHAAEHPDQVVVHARPYNS